MKRYNKPEYTDARKRIRQFIKEHKRLPKYCKFKNQQGRIDRLTRREYCGLFQGYAVFCLKHNREPNYLTYTSDSAYPVAVNYQDDSVSCCPASFVMVSLFLFEWIPEAKVKKTFGTNKNGTTPTQLIQGAKKLGYKVTPIPRTFRDVKKALDSYCPVIMQIETKSAGNCLGFQRSYGHYIFCFHCDTNKYWVIDPTKGKHTCNSTVLNKATGGGNRKFYKVEIL